jgi:hypothetical protein
MMIFDCVQVQVLEVRSYLDKKSRTRTRQARHEGVLRS